MRTALALVGVIVLTAVVAFAAEPDRDIGIVNGPENPSYDPENPTETSQYGEEGGPLIAGCYDVSIKCLIGATTPGAAIVVHAYHTDPNQNQTFEIDPGQPPEELHCDWLYVEIEYHPGGPPDGYAGYGVSWTPAS